MNRIGIDIGGTFTDLVLYNEDLKTTHITKTTTTTENLFKGAKIGMNKLGVNLKSLSDISHGTTIGTNAIIQKKGAKVAMITTKGMRDILEADAGVRGVLYNIRGRRTDPLVKRSWRYEVKERVLSNGVITQPLDLEELKEVLYQIAKTDAEAVAVCFLNSYVNGENENKTEKLIQEILPNCFVSISSKISKYGREFERFSTTVLNGYLGPLVSPYIKSILNSLKEEGYDKPFWVMTAAGGAVEAEVSQQNPIFTINSGPAAGVTASAYLAKLLGYKNVISYDMGGTSTDVSLIRSYKPDIIRDVPVSGYPNVAPQLDIVTIGSGGGTLSWVDNVGAFQLGPLSMGAFPGPACYGLGGTEATITDAALLIGWLNPNQPLGGEVTLYPELARKAISKLAILLKGIDEYKIAEAIVKMAIVKMVGAIKIVSTGRGFDARDFTLIAFGGAGPMFATHVASEMGISRVVVPLGPGNFCAIGTLQSDVIHQYLRPVGKMTSGITIAALQSMFREMEERGNAQLIKGGFSEENIHFEERITVMYSGQHFTIEIPMTNSIKDLEKAFYEAHKKLYRFSFEEQVMISDIIVNTYGSKPKAMMAKAPTKIKKSVDALCEKRPACFGGQFIETPVYHRDDVPGDFRIRGPVIFEELGSTTVVQPGWTANIDNMGNLILEKEE